MRVHLLLPVYGRKEDTSKLEAEIASLKEQ